MRVVLDGRQFCFVVGLSLSVEHRYIPYPTKRIDPWLEMFNHGRVFVASCFLVQYPQKKAWSWFRRRLCSCAAPSMLANSTIHLLESYRSSFLVDVVSLGLIYAVDSL